MGREPASNTRATQPEPPKTEDARLWREPKRWPEPLPAIAVDTHGHLSDPAFHADRGEVVQRAWQAGVRYILDPGVDRKSSQVAVQNARAFSTAVRAAVGVHPHEAAVTTEADWREIERLAALDEVVAIGEIGLDAFRERAPRDRQEAALERCLALAERLHKPVLVHVRDAYPRVLEILGPYPPVRGIVHAFWGDRKVAGAFLDRGFLLGLGGALTFRREEGLRDVAATLPPRTFVLETDAPYLAPHPVRGSRCESALLAFTARALAEVRHVDLTALLEETTQAAADLFPLWPMTAATPA